MPYLSNEHLYRNLMQNFTYRSLGVAEFEQRFFDQWRADRDAQWKAIKSGNGVNADERELCEVLDQAFTALDCYTPNPTHALHISEAQLRSEITHLFDARWQSGKT